MVSTTNIGSQINYCRLTSVLSYAFLEWFLMFLLFLSAAFSFLLTKFARLFKLQAPCMICSNLDHVFGNEKPGLYSGLICESHKSEISLLSYCALHQKLANVHEMCEECLIPFAPEKLIDKDRDESVPLLKKNLDPDYVVASHCSCCSSPLEDTTNVVKSPGKSRDLDDMSRDGYNEVKVISDSDSEVPFSFDNGGIIANPETQDLDEDTKDQSITNEFAPVTTDSSFLVHIGTSSQDVSSKLSPLSETVSEAVSETVLPDSLNTEENHEDTTTTSREHDINAPNSKINKSTSGPSVSIPSHIDLTDAFKLATGTKSNLASPVSDVITGRDSFRVQEDLKILITQMSAARGFETPWNDLSPSPRVQWQGEDASLLDNITRRISIDRNESGFESFDGSIISEIEGESVVDRLKRQIELDRKSLYLLYKELEEERGASTIAANQAMAMITRLQEEKAAMQMEALQYQRMMEEQAEYDQEALMKSNEQLAEREKDIQDLEADIESYRNANFKEPSLDFEDEKAYITNCLKKLEEKLQLYSSNVLCPDDNGENNLGIDSPHFNAKTSFSLSSDREESNIATLQVEFSRLNERVKALEADHNFLEHAINSSRYGDSGTEFIQEIARDLRELRRIGIRRREHSVA